ncbi:adenosylhomocysteinase [Propionicimonas paludicola]|uniref:adenosylhomocysteinase n=1 Tax=Propionicimonas paludicola TaxID=185243 RepID=UPI000BF673E3|nr:adenosylhomocysteinase [Propionicimonas paludicola]
MLTSELGWAELVLRRYARQTNQLIAGRSFSVTGSAAPADALRLALTRIGAQLVAPDDPRAAAVFTPEALASDFAGARDSAAQRIDYAWARMPAVTAAGERLAASVALNGLRVGLSLVLEPKTAVLALALHHAGAQVSLLGRWAETDQEVAAELARRGLTVFATDDESQDAALADAFLGQRLQVLLDDGSRLIRMLLERPEDAVALIGAAEETTSGLWGLEGHSLPFPVIAVNDAGSKLWFDNAHGTGQSCLFTIADLVAPDAAWLGGRRVALAGFGAVGEGFARHAAALGAQVRVADIDPRAELRARFVGFPTGSFTELVTDAELIVSATGRAGTIGVEILEAAADGAVLAVAGGVDGEVDLAGALAAGWQLVEVGPKVADLVRDGRRLRLLDRGECINCTAGEGNPIEIMDLSLAVQAAAVEYLLAGTLAPGLVELPLAADQLVARTALEHWEEPR